MELIIISLYSYLLGAIPSAYVIGKLRNVDITTKGSGNIGGTNAYRVLGARWGILVALMDVGKVLTALIVTQSWLGTEWAMALSAFFAVVGHNWSVYVKFKGGKGIAVSIGTYLYLFPVLGLVSLGVALFNILVTKYVSLASMNFVLTMMILLFFVQDHPAYKLLGVALLVMAVWRHRSNVKGLRSGKERRFGEKSE